MIYKGLPTSFCKNNLPSKEFRMVLEDEEGVEFDAVYIGNRTGLSGGWRGFAMHHSLEEGDSLVFELAEHDKFKVLKIMLLYFDIAHHSGPDRFSHLGCLNSQKFFTLCYTFATRMKTKSKLSDMNTLEENMF